MKPDKRLADTKVYVAGKSKEIHENVLRLGYRVDIFDKQYRLTYPFMFFHENGKITYGTDMENFVVNNNKEVTADYILSIKPTEEPGYDFKPFDRVLVRDKDTDEWSPDFFMNYLTQGVDDYSGNKVRTISRIPYKQCIPYKGNEHLIFTTDSPKQ